MDEWYAVQCHVRQEYQTSVTLYDSFGLRVFLPTVYEYQASRCREVILFPGYLFVELGIEGQAPRLLSTVPGVVRVVGYGGIPQPIPATTIASLREQIALVNSNGGLGSSVVCAGSHVTIARGPLQGLEAIFQRPLSGGERVAVLVRMLGRICNAEVAVDDLAGQAVPTLRRRTTRGRGRRIAVRHE